MWSNQYLAYDRLSSGMKELLAHLRTRWWHTGDLAYYDQDGFFYFSGRKKDALRRRGENVSAFEVEQALMTHSAVLHAAVVAAPSSFSEDDILAVIVKKPDAVCTEQEIFTHANRSLPYFMVPRYIAFADSLPETATGKLSKSRLAERVMNACVWDSEHEGLSASRARDVPTTG